MSNGDENLAEKRTEASDRSDSESENNSTPTQRFDSTAVEFDPEQSDETF